MTKKAERSPHLKNRRLSGVEPRIVQQRESQRHISELVEQFSVQLPKSPIASHLRPIAMLKKIGPLQQVDSSRRIVYNLIKFT